MSQDRFPISPEGYKRLESELHHLKTIERPNIIASIAEARAHGDLSENAEYDAAKERQALIEAKIRDFESKLSRAQVIDISKNVSNVIQFGATVEIKDEDTEAIIVYKIVSEYEADIQKKHISISSPLARALIGKRAGEGIEVNTPKGNKYYQILSFKFI